MWNLCKRKNCTVFVRIKRNEEHELFFFFFFFLVHSWEITKIWKSDVQILLEYKYFFPLLSFVIEFNVKSDLRIRIHCQNSRTSFFYMIPRSCDQKSGWRYDNSLLKFKDHFIFTCRTSQNPTARLTRCNYGNLLLKFKFFIFVRHRIQFRG